MTFPGKRALIQDRWDLTGWHVVCSQQEHTPVRPSRAAGIEYCGTRIITMTICIVCSSGGHLFEARRLTSVLQDCSVVWVTFKKEDALTMLKGEEVIFAHHPTQRSLANLAKNFLLAWKVFKSRRIDAVVSTGAGVAVPFLVLGKLQRRKTIYIESVARIHDLSFTGKLVYRFTDYFLVQWPELLEKYPKAIYKGRLL